MSNKAWSICATDAEAFIERTEEFLGVSLKSVHMARGPVEGLLELCNRSASRCRRVAKRTDVDGNTLDLIFLVGDSPVWGVRSREMYNYRYGGGSTASATPAE